MAGHTARIMRMIAATASIEFVSTTTETEALLLEANLIKRLRPRFNVLMRDDKSFPYILITAGETAPMIAKHRGARIEAGRILRPVRLGAGGASHHHRAGARVPDPLLLRHRVREPHAAVPAAPDQALRGALHRRDLAHRLCRAGARGEGVPLRQEPRREGGTGGRDGEGLAARSISSAPRSTATGSRRSRRCSRARGSIRAPWRKPTCSPCTSRAAIRASRCSSSAPGRTGATAPTSRAPTARSSRARCSARSWRSSMTTSRRRAASSCRTRSRTARCSPRRSRVKSGHKVEVSLPQRGEKKELVDHALANAREALGRKLAETQSQQNLLGALGETFGLAEAAAPHRGVRQQPHPGQQRGRRHDRRGAGGVSQEPVPQVQHQVGEPHAGRRLRHDARGADAAVQAADGGGAAR